ncbi:MAG: diguanylate cyclase [Phenylobacterium sp.]
MDSKFRSPGAYDLARFALERLEALRIWPTPLNYELWSHVLADPDSPLAQELERLRVAGEPVTEDLAEQLAATYLPGGRLRDRIRDTGQALSRQLASAEQAIRTAQESSESFSSRLEETSRTLESGPSASTLETVVADLSDATRKMQAQNASVERALAASTTEVSLLTEQLERIRKEAATDPLTRLANRRAFDEAIEQIRQKALETGKSFCLALLDVDHFKKFNDTWGHQTGDQVLRYVAGAIRKRTTPPKFAARFGGEEFAILLPGQTLKETRPLVEAILKDVSAASIRRRSTNENLGKITLSAGIASFRPGDSVHQLIERADWSLYEAKRTGRNRLVVEKDL